MVKEDYYITDHYGWQVSSNGDRYLAFTDSEGAARYAIVNSNHSSVIARGLTIDSFSLNASNITDSTALQNLIELGTVQRVRNYDLWTAVGTCVIRQVIRAPQARIMYANFCQKHGEKVEIKEVNEVYNLFPKPDAVLHISDQEYTDMGMKFKQRALQNAARAFIIHQNEWLNTSARVLIDELQQVQQIGNWTAHAAVADYTNDWSAYPYGDASIKAYVQKAVPGYNWSGTSAQFMNQWETLTGGDISNATVLAMGWYERNSNV